LRKLEGKIIEQLKAEIDAKKSALNGLESRKSDLEKNLSALQGKPSGSQRAEEQPASSETAEPVQQDTVGTDTELTVVEYQQE
jgi:hypothetical protein